MLYSNIIMIIYVKLDEVNDIVQYSDINININATISGG